MGAINLDSNAAWEPDLVRDVSRGLPFDDKSVDKVTTSHVLEHLETKDLMFLVGEIYRVLKTDSQWVIVVPIGNTGDIEHTKLFTETSFDILCRPEASIHFGSKMRWHQVSKNFDRYALTFVVRAG